MRIRVPFFKQDTEYTCGPASLQMVLAFFNDRKSEAKLSRSMHTSRAVGTRHHDLIHVACQEGFHVYVNSNSTIDELRHFLSLKMPVIVDYTERSSDDGHYAVVIGITKAKLIMHDPWNGKNYSISMRAFKRRWHDVLTRSQQWIMVMSRSDFGLGKQYLPY